MGTTWAGRLATVGILLVPVAMAAVADEPAAPPAPSAASETPQSGSAEAAEAAKALADAKERLAILGKLPEKDQPPSAKALKADLEDRVGLLQDWQDAAKAYHEAQDPKVNPERQATKWKNELEQVNAQLAEATKHPDAFIPAAFRKPAHEVTDAVLSEMKDTIEEWRAELKDLKSRLEKFQSSAARKAASPLAALRSERDKIHMRVVALPGRRTEREAAIAAAKSEDERTLARERLSTFGWEERVESQRLKAKEAEIALAGKRTGLDELEQRVCDARCQLKTRTLALLQARYQEATSYKESRLKQVANTEQDQAEKTDDPLVRFKARWNAQLHDLEAQALKYENAVASSAPPSLEEQTSLADQAENDLAIAKRMLEDNLVSQLGALRLNNTFRRIAAQRSRIISGELAEVARQLTYYDNALSNIELELAYDRRADEYEQQSLLDRLPAGRHRDAKVAFAELDRKHEVLLNRNRVALGTLATRAGQTHQQIQRRLRTLDEEYGFIRTHLFWVRDQEPMGWSTIVRGQRDFALVGISILRLAQEAADRRLWGRVSVEFLCGSFGLVVLVWPLLRLRKILMRKSGEPRRGTASVNLMHGALVGAGYSAILPAYLGLMAYTARQAPWPRGLAIPVSASLAMLVPAALIAGLVRWMLRPGGWAEQSLEVPPEVTRQLRRTVFVLVAAGVPLLLPPWLLSQRLIAPSGRPISCSALGQILGFGFELIVLGVVFRLLRAASPLFHWLLQFPERVGWLNRHRRAICWSALLAMAGVITLDALGYSYSARRLALGAGEGLLVVALCMGIYRMILRAIDHHAWRWIRVRHGHIALEAPADTTMPEDLAHRLRRLTAYVVPIFGLWMAAWVWDVDWALFRFVSDQTLWNAADTPVKVGDFTKFTLVMLLTLAVWHHMSTFFAVAVFPRMRDDPGVRFAVLTLCRYAVLAVGLLAGLSAIHLGLEKIGVVLAALGVGLGFGLQEIVSNFVCGIILLLERPIRVGDVVTVSGMTGQVDRINIRATTIINGDNQSIIVPNRAFITSDLVNWTLKDKIIRVSIRLKVAVGTDPDRVAELLLEIAREDADVLRNPLPSAFMEDFSDSALNFALHVHVPDPSLGARVRHRLFVQVQRRFVEEQIEIPLPTHRLRVHSTGDASGRTASLLEFPRLDPASPTPPAPRLTSSPPAAVEDCHRGVDE